jgi:hypothetical protein
VLLLFYLLLLVPSRITSRRENRRCITSECTYIYSWRCTRARAYVRVLPLADLPAVLKQWSSTSTSDLDHQPACMGMEAEGDKRSGTHAPAGRWAISWRVGPNSQRPRGRRAGRRSGTGRQRRYPSSVRQSPASRWLNARCMQRARSVRLAGGWWLVLICSERRVLLAGCGWLLVADSFREKSTAGWWLISRANRL